MILSDAIGNEMVFRPQSGFKEELREFSKFSVRNVFRVKRGNGVFRGNLFDSCENQKNKLLNTGCNLYLLMTWLTVTNLLDVLLQP